MKRTVLFAGIALVLAGLAPADAEAQGNFRLGRLGVKAGYISTSLNGSADDSTLNLDYESKGGFGGGLFIRGHMNDWLGIQSEFLFLRRGTGVANTEIKATYFQLPVQLRVSLAPTADVNPVIFAGPAFITRVGSTDGNSPIFGYFGEKLDNLTRSTGIEIVAGAGVDIDSFSLEFRYSQGLKKYFVDALDRDEKWREIGFFVSYQFPRLGFLGL